MARTAEIVVARIATMPQPSNERVIVRTILIVIAVITARLGLLRQKLRLLRVIRMVSMALKIR